jgi:hypothetical protein
MLVLKNSLMVRLLFSIFIALFTNIRPAQLAPPDYYPLELGNRWDYTDGFYPHTEKIVDTTTISGSLHYGLAMWSGEEPELWLRNDKGVVYLFNLEDSTDYVLFNFNAEVGQSWELPVEYGCSFGNKITLVSKNDTVTTPAGVFICYHFEHQPSCIDAGIFDTWFAEGIGKVRTISDNFAGIMDYQLTEYNLITSINHQEQVFTAESYRLFQNYPNPFNSTTIIPYFLLNSGRVTIRLYDISGKEVLLLANDYKAKGYHDAVFDASNISSGTYFYRIEIGSQFVSTKKLIYIK